MKREFAVVQFEDENFVRCFMRVDDVALNDGNPVMTLGQNKAGEYECKWIYDSEDIDNRAVSQMMDMARERLQVIRF